MAAHAEIASYIHGFYNPTRLHSSVGYVSPDVCKETQQRNTETGFLISVGGTGSEAAARCGASGN